MRTPPLGLLFMGLTFLCATGCPPAGGEDAGASAVADATADDASGDARASDAAGRDRVSPDTAGRDAGQVDATAADAREPDGARADVAAGDSNGGDNPTADAGGSDAAAADRAPVDIGGGDVTYVPSEELGTLAAQLALLQAGEPADLDGDGSPDTARAVEGGGAVSASQDLDDDGWSEWAYAYDGNGGAFMTIDADSDGWPEQELTVTVTPDAERKVLLSDSDGDGVADRRQTWETLASAPNDQRYTDEQDAEGSGDWVEVSSGVISKTKFLGDPCMDGFPSSGTDWNPWAWLPSITIRTGDGGGACNADQARQAAAAADCAMSKGGLCLAMTNSAMAASLNAALNGDTVMPLVIGCGNGCPNSLAATKSWSKPWFSDSKMNLGAGFWGLDAAGQCNVMLHEMLHWAGNEGSADHNDAAGPGDDAVYSCGRYCGRCSDAAHGSPGNSSVDCARCADSAGRKERCGSQTEYQTADCGDNMIGVCHRGLGCISGSCEECGGTVTYDCNGGVLRTQVSCCATCPSGCDGSNDFPCGTPPAPTDSCTDGNPPACR